MAFKDIFVTPPKTEIEAQLPERIVGRIYHLNRKGFGFIESESIPQERIYFHWKALNHNTKKFSDLIKGDEVEFTPKMYDKNKGWQAQRIAVLT